jgi:hypothetical protein
MRPLNQETVDNVINFLVNLTQHTEIVDHVSGRITLSFSISALGLLREEGASLTGMIDAIPGLKGYSMSLLWRSVVIDYDSSVLPDDLWSDLLALEKMPELKASVLERLASLFNGKHKMSPLLR